MLMRDANRNINQIETFTPPAYWQTAKPMPLITGLTRLFASCLEDLRLMMDLRQDERLMTYSWLSRRGERLFIADTSVHEDPSPEQLALIAKQTAAARRLGTEPALPSRAIRPLASNQPRQPQNPGSDRTAQIRIM